MIINNDILFLNIGEIVKKNLLNMQVINELHKCLDVIEEREGIRMLILFSNRKASSPGKHSGTDDYDEQTLLALSEVCRRIELLSIPTVAAMTGFAAGIGTELALCCDHRIVGESVQLGFDNTTTNVNIEIGGRVRLSWLIGEEKARFWMNRIIDSDTALRTGLAQNVTEDRFLQKAAETFAAVS